MTREEYRQEAARLRPKLVGMARLYLAEAEEAEDIVQDVLLKLWLLRDRLHAPIDALAKVITRNHARDRRRRQHPTVDIGAAAALADDTSDRGRQQLIEKMMATIDTLPPSQQIILRLRHMEGMSYADIASLIGSNETAVRKAISRARNAVKDHFLTLYTQ